MLLINHVSVWGISFIRLSEYIYMYKATFFFFFLFPINPVATLGRFCMVVLNDFKKRSGT